MQASHWAVVVLACVGFSGLACGSSSSGSGGSGGKAGTGGATGGGGSGGTAGTGGTGGSDAGTTATVLDCAGQTIAKTITIKNLAFSPTSETLKVGEIVKFDNQDTVTHTSTSGTPASKDGNWDTGNIAAGSSKCVKLNTAGTYPYFCAIHTTMTGTLSVN